MISVCDEYSEETFYQFLDCVQGIKSLHLDRKIKHVILLSDGREGFI